MSHKEYANAGYVAQVHREAFMRRLQQDLGEFPSIGYGDQRRDIAGFEYLFMGKFFGEVCFRGKGDTYACAHRVGIYEGNGEIRDIDSERDVSFVLIQEPSQMNPTRSKTGRISGAHLETVTNVWFNQLMSVAKEGPS